MLAPLLLCGCGRQSSQMANIAYPSHPIWCPGKLRPPYRQGESDARRFDTRSLLGLSESKAEAQTVRNGCLWRVVERNGHRLPITADLRDDRVNAGLNHEGIVVSVGVY